MTGVQPLSTPRARLYVTTEATGVADWADVTTRILSPEGVRGYSIRNGNQGASAALPEPDQFTGVFDDTDGYLNEFNPAGPWHGSIGLNTPIQIDEVFDTDGFDRTVASGLGTSPGGYTYDNTGSAGTVAGDFNVALSKATQSVALAGGNRVSLVHDGPPAHAAQLCDIRLHASFQLPGATVTGDAVSAALVTRDNAAGRVICRARIYPDAHITLQYSWANAAGAETTLSAETTVYGLTHTGQILHMVVSVEDCQYRVKIWQNGDPEPYGWDLDQQYDNEAVFTPAAGKFGFRSACNGANSNAKPYVISWLSFEWSSPRFTGFLSSIKDRVTDESSKQVLADVMASGVLQQLVQGNRPVNSTLRRSIPFQIGLVAYWPMEDGADADRFTSAFPDYPALEVIDGTPSYGAWSTLKASKGLPNLNQAVLAGEVPDHNYTGESQVRFFLNLPAAGSTDGLIICRFYMEYPGSWFYQLLYKTGGNLELQVRDTEAAVIHTSGTLGFALDGIPSRVSVQLAQNGADVDWSVVTMRVGARIGGSISGTFTGNQLATCKKVFFNNNWTASPRLTDVGVGHTTVQNIITDIFDLLDETNAYSNELTYVRVGRLAGENAFTANVRPGRDAHINMGAQRPGNLPDLLEQCIEAGLAAVYGARGDAAMCYRDITSMYSRDFAVTVDYQQLQLPWEPVNDYRDVRNVWTGSRIDGSTYEFNQQNGRRGSYSVVAGGVGRFESSKQFNLVDDTLVPHELSLRAQMGTVAEPRWDVIKIERALPLVAADAALNQQLLDARPGDRIEVGRYPGINQYNTVRQHINAYEEIRSGFLHTFSYVTTSNTPYDAFKVEDTTLGRLDSDSTVLDVALDNASTTVQIVSTEDWWTGANVPFDISINGEQMTVTAVTDPTPSFIAVGAAAHADNGNVTPGLPAGHTAKDLLLIIDAVRDFGATATPPNALGYTLIGDATQLRVWGKYDGGAESAPLMTIAGGAAGTTHSAIMACFRNVSMTEVATGAFGLGVATQNSSAQNINYLSAYAPVYKALALVIGAKADDWTSVAALSGFTEIVDIFSALGNDQGLVADYQALTTVANQPPGVGIGSGTFTVTGGASATSSALSMLLAIPQVFTVTRGVNMTPKTHRAGSRVRLFRPAHYAI